MNSKNQAPTRVLYISLDGMTEALGESQVIQYLLDLAKTNSIYLLSFEKPGNQTKYATMQKRLQATGIQWQFFIYSNRYGVLSSLWQIIRVFFKLKKWVRSEKIALVHSRSFIPGILGALLKKTCKTKFLFDIRGFAIDEKIIHGRLKENGMLTRGLKWLEHMIYKSADHIVTLTHISKPIIIKQFKVDPQKVTVIPTCANPKIFKKINSNERKAFRAKLGVADNEYILLRNGSLNGWYDFEAELLLTKALIEIEPQIKLIILNHGQHQLIKETLEKMGLDQRHYMLKSIPFNEMYHYLNSADLNLFLIKPCFAKQASTPTKFAENIACELFSITNKNYGDMEYYFSNFNVGQLVDLKLVHQDTMNVAKTVWSAFKGFGKKSQLEKTAEFQQLFEEHFSKEHAVNLYDKIYQSLTNPKP